MLLLTNNFYVNPSQESALYAPSALPLRNGAFCWAEVVFACSLRFLEDQWLCIGEAVQLLWDWTLIYKFNSYSVRATKNWISYIPLWVSGSVVGWGTMVQAGRPWIRFPTRSLNISIYLILPAALWPWVDWISCDICSCSFACCFAWAWCVILCDACVFCVLCLIVVPLPPGKTNLQFN
jgi:hypothetical protein